MNARIKTVLSSSLTHMVITATVAAAFVLIVRPTGGAGGAMPALTREAIASPDSIGASGHRSGQRGAAHTLVLFSDFECPFCKRFEAVLAEMEKEGQPLEVVFRHHPLQIHSRALPAAVAAECAGQQGRFQQMRAVLFSSLDTTLSDPWVSLARLANVPDMGAFSRCLDSDAPREAIRRDIIAARSAGLEGTPLVILDGQRLSRPPTGDELKAMLAMSRD